MRRMLNQTAILLVLGAAPSWATLTDPLPANPCVGGAGFGMNLSVLDVSGDGGLPPPCNGPNVETAITCLVKETSGPVDLAIEYFDASGALISPPVPITFCGLLEGASVTFATSPVPPPYTPTAIVPVAAPVPANPFCAPLTPGCFLHGSARILSTSKKIQCTATRIDFAGPCFGGPPMPLSTKDLTILFKAKQVGD